MPINLEAIAQLDWEKKWAAKFTLFSCSYWGKQYYFDNKSVHNIQFDHSFFLSKHGVISTYQSTEENKLYGERFAKKLLDNPDYIHEWIETLKRKTDEIIAITKKPMDYFFDLSSYQIFEKAFDEYQPTYVPVNRVPNYLDPSIRDRVWDSLMDGRTYSEELYRETDTLFVRILESLSERTGLPKVLTACIFYDEFVRYLHDRSLPSVETLQERNPICGLYYERGERHVLSEKDALRFEELVEKQFLDSTNEIVGVCAVTGSATGLVRIVHDAWNVGNFNDGDILVTGMTRPEFVPLMKRAAAVVTDAGGVLCHAAIVCRELCKPCVIGTKVATKVLKDGDMVEVDAYRGIIKKL